VEERGVAQGIWPQRKVNCLWPASTSVQQLLVCPLQEIVDGALSDAILEMGVYATEGELLVHFVARLLKCIVRELTVVAVIMLNFYAVLGGEGLEGARFWRMNRQLEGGWSAGGCSGPQRSWRTCIASW
jgi:hypothetical protein